MSSASSVNETAAETRVYWYRANDTQYAGGVDEFGDVIPGDRGPIGIRIDKYEVAKQTPCGVQLDLGYRRRFVRKDSYRRWACPTEDEALASLLARRRRQASIYEARAKQADRVVAIVENMIAEGKRDAYVHPWELWKLSLKTATQLNQEKS